MALTVDWTRCDGHGLCAALLPSNARNAATTAPRGASSGSPNARHRAGSPTSVSQHPSQPQ